MDNEKKDKKNINENVIEKVENKINELITNEGVKKENVDYLYKLIDIHKDLKNENYWEKKEENIMYMRDDYGNDYGNDYRGGRSRDSRGRYMGDRRGDYRGQRVLDEMYDGYRNYSDGREEYNRGNYGAKGEAMKSLEYMLGSVTDFIEMLQRDAGSQEEIDMIKKYTRRISEM